MVDFDETGSIGKRYRRQDEIGTPFCITYDFDSVEDKAVTVRDRDTMEQVRMPISELKRFLREENPVLIIRKRGCSLEQPLFLLFTFFFNCYCTS